MKRLIMIIIDIFGQCNGAFFIQTNAVQIYDQWSGHGRKTIFSMLEQDWCFPAVKKHILWVPKKLQNLSHRVQCVVAETFFCNTDLAGWRCDCQSQLNIELINCFWINTWRTFLCETYWLSSPRIWPWWEGNPWCSVGNNLEGNLIVWRVLWQQSPCWCWATSWAPAGRVPAVTLTLLWSYPPSKTSLQSRVQTAPLIPKQASCNS